MLLAAAFLSTLCGFAGCDDGGPAEPVDTVTCGTGTTLMDDQCVPTSDGVDCGPGTMDDGSGQCVPTSELVCGPGTTANQAGECIPDDQISCGAGTEDDGTGTCVRVCPAGTTDDGAGNCTVDPQSCPPGTSDDGQGGCALDLASICALGTVPSNDGARCITPADAVRESVDAETTLASSEEASPTSLDDPLLAIYAQAETTDYDGTPILAVSAIERSNAGEANALTLPAVGNTVVLDGTITLLGDVTSDTLADQDWDVWAFQGVAGQVLEVAMVSDAIGAPYFDLIAVAGVDSDADLDTFGDLGTIYGALDVVRFAPQGQYEFPSRQFLLPRDGLYFLRVTDDRHQAPALATVGIFGDITVLSNEGAPTGSDDAAYFVTVSTLATLDGATLPTVDTGAASVTFQGSAADYGRVLEETVLVTGAGGQPGFVRINVTGYDPVVSGVLSFFTADFGQRIQQFLADDGVELLLPVDASGLIVSHDFSALVGVAQEGYRVDIVGEPVLTPFQGSTFSLQDGTAATHAVQAEGGSILRVELRDVGAGVTPILALFGYNPDLTQTLVGCVGYAGTVNPAVCQVVPEGTPLVMSRFFEGAGGEVIPAAVFVLDAALGEGTGGGYTLEPRTIVPQQLSIDAANPTAQTGFTLAPPADSRWVIVDIDALAELTLSAASSGADVTLELFDQDAGGLLVAGDTVAAANPATYDLLANGAMRLFVRIATSGAATSSDVTFDATITRAGLTFTQTHSPGLAIPDGGFPTTVATSTLAVDTTAQGAACTLSELIVTVDITHTWASDTRLTLIGPDATRYTLDNGSGLGSGDYGVHTYPGTRTPVTDLAVLQGTSADGTWTLEAGDIFSSDQGTLNGWSLSMFLDCP